MILAIVIFISLSTGFFLAEMWHRQSIYRGQVMRRRNALLAEYFDKQLWQFISIDEWLTTNGAKLISHTTVYSK